MLRIRVLEPGQAAQRILERPAYRNAFLKRRCIVPAEAFYEWVGPKKERQPLSIARADGRGSYRWQGCSNTGSLQRQKVARC